MEMKIFDGMGDFVYLPLKHGVSTPMFDTSEEAWNYAEKAGGVEVVAERKRDSISRVCGIFSALAIRQEQLDDLIGSGIISVGKAIEDFNVTLTMSESLGLITSGENKRLSSSYKAEIRRLVAKTAAINEAIKAAEKLIAEEADENIPESTDARYDTTYSGACAFAKYLDARRIPYEFNEGKSFLDAVIVIPAEYDDEGVKNAFACIQK
jgi:hypothetical protein